MQIRLEGHDLPGRSCGPSPDVPEGYANIHVGVQRRAKPTEHLDLQPGDAAAVRWSFEADVRASCLHFLDQLGVGHTLVCSGPS